MTFSLHLIGTSFKACHLDLVSQVQWADQDVCTRFMEHAKCLLGLDEIFYLQTCNRREFYIYAPHPRVTDLQNAFLGALQESLQKDLSPVSFYYRQDEQVALHMMRVAASLDSMVLGETEIMRQFKDQMAVSLEAGFSGRRLQELVQAALSTAKQVRHQTKITKNVVSMASLAFRKAVDHQGGAKPRKRIAFVGAGHFIQSIMPTFSKKTDWDFLFINRTLPTQLAQTYGGRAISLQDFLTSPEPFDVLISATGAPHQIFGCEWVTKHGLGRLFLDAALPRDIDPKVAELDGVTYMDLEEMDGILEANRATREAEIPKAEPFFLEALQSLHAKWLECDLSGIHRSISEHYRQAGEKALDYLLRQELNHISIEDKAALEKFTQSLVKKLTKVPILGLKGVAKEFGKPAVHAYTSSVASASAVFKKEEPAHP